MLKLIVTINFIMILMLTLSLNAQTVFINEIHYDNDGGDVHEGVEIAGSAGTDLTDWQIIGYNGNGGGSYSPTTTLSGTIPDQQNGFGTIWFPIAGLQNGSPDGMALVDNVGSVIQFLSYEGTFDATDGPANGMTSNDIGVSESSTSPIGQSLQLQGTGAVYTDFFWAGPTDTTYGEVNTGQTFTNVPVDHPPVISNFAYEPIVPIASENTIVTAEITDDSGLSLVEFDYIINNGTINPLTMDNISGNTYAAEIPSSAYIDGDLVEFSIYVEDDASSHQSAESNHVQFFAGTTSIFVAKQVDGDGILVNDGVAARLTGVAIVENGTFSTSDMDVYIQDATGGINLFMFSQAAQAITIGHEYTVVGTLDQYNGKAEIIPDDVADITDGGTATVPDVIVITIDDLLNEPETYEGMLIQILDADNVGGTWPGPNITLNDGSTNTLTMYIDSDTDIDESIEGEYPMDVTGVFSQFDNSSPYTSGYEIIPRSVTDLVWTASAIERVENAGVITEFKLHSNFPNPFNPSTTLQFDVPKQVDNLDLSIYNTAGQKIVTLYQGSASQGSYQYTWNGINQGNQAAPSGIYFAVLKTVNFTQSIKMMLIK